MPSLSTLVLFVCTLFGLSTIATFLILSQTMFRTTTALDVIIIVSVYLFIVAISFLIAFKHNNKRVRRRLALFVISFFVVFMIYFRFFFEVTDDTKKIYEISDRYKIYLTEGGLTPLGEITIKDYNQTVQSFRNFNVLVKVTQLKDDNYQLILSLETIHNKAKLDTVVISLPDKW